MTSQSCLNRNTITLNGSVMSFYSYYTYGTPIYYEVVPIVELLKFTKKDAIIAAIPQVWVKSVESLNDPVFDTHKIHKDVQFVEASAIAYLISISENKTLANTVTNLYNMCIRKIETDRIKLVNDKVVSLKKKVKSLEDDITNLNETHGKKLTELKQAHQNHTEQNADFMSIMKETMNIVVGKNKELGSAFEALISYLEP